jgi:hypothetical protein
MLSELEIENLQLRKVNIELQSKLMQIEHAKIVKELENARPVPDNTPLQQA